MPSFIDTLKSLHQRCLQNHHRALVVVAGRQQWTQSTHADILTALPELHPTLVAEPASAKQLLGSETSSIIFDGFAGFNLNALAISAGTIKGGGLMILLCPPLEDWGSFDDPEYQRLLAHPYTSADISGLFLNRLQLLVENDPIVLCLEENHQEKTFTLPAPTSTSVSKTAKQLDTADAQYANDDQRTAVEKIIKLSGGRARRPLLITADRGRGKSAALGLAAAKLLDVQDTDILVTAPTPKAANTVFKHANHSDLPFISPDELLNQLPPTRLLLVDEAAAIPLPILEQIILHYPRVVLTTTMHGYEGTGRGFALRFTEVLNRITPNWQQLQLTQAVRFSNNDPLENFIHRALILDAELDNVDADSGAPTVIKIEDRQALASNERKLRSVFGLLMLAHYQTTPDDLRHMLDAPNIDVFTLSIGDHIIAAAMVATEGSLQAELIEQIHAGKRRPKGHLLPQTLIFQCNLPDAGSMRSARVIRIAVLPDHQGHGFGSQLIQAIEKHYRVNKYDLVGTSFGLEKSLLKFWQTQLFHCVRVGSRRNAASTYHSALLVKPLSEQALSLNVQAQVRFTSLFITQLPALFKKLDPKCVALLLSDHSGKAELSNNALAESENYVSGKRNRYDVLDSLQQVVLDTLRDAPGSIEPSERDLLVACFFQQLPDQSLCQQFQLNGAKILTRKLREAMQKIISARRQK